MAVDAGVAGDGRGHYRKRPGPGGRGVLRRDVLDLGAPDRVRHEVHASGGETVTRDSTFTTLSRQDTFIGTYLPDRGATVGVAMPVSVVFDKPIHDKAAVERQLEVTSTPAVEGAWSWMTDRDGKDRIDFRPREYWEPGTEVTLRMDLVGWTQAAG
jgi:lipoprotein-anchoring transpeptidase ErfK/SrfK